MFAPRVIGLILSGFRVRLGSWRDYRIASTFTRDNVRYGETDNSKTVHIKLMRLMKGAAENIKQHQGHHARQRNYIYTQNKAVVNMR